MEATEVVDNVVDVVTVRHPSVQAPRTAHTYRGPAEAGRRDEVLSGVVGDVHQLTGARATGDVLEASRVGLAEARSIFVGEHDHLDEFVEAERGDLVRLGD